MLDMLNARPVNSSVGLLVRTAAKRLKDVLTTAMQFANVIRYIFISFASLIVGGFVGCFGGMALGWLLALGYHRQGPSDPGDAPAYVALGLMFVGALAGAVAGLIVGIILCVRSARRNAADSSMSIKSNDR